MTAAHLLFAVGLTVYVLIAIRYEERDLIEFHSEYKAYRRRVPMMVPIGVQSKTADEPVVKNLAS